MGVTVSQKLAGNQKTLTTAMLQKKPELCKGHDIDANQKTWAIGHESARAVLNFGGAKNGRKIVSCTVFY